MKHTAYTLFIVSAISIALCGCRRESLDPTGNAIRYKVTVADIATKGELVNNNVNGDYSDIALAQALSQFKVAAYNGTNPVFTTSTLSPAGVETVTYTDGSWTMPNTYYWPQKTILTFFAWGNLPENSSVEVTSAGQTLTHEMVSAVANQKDILLGYYKGYGENGNTAEIRFQHPLTAVIFREGDLGGEKVESISLEGLGASGTVTMGANGIIDAWDVSDYTATSSQSNSEGLAVNSTTKVIGDPFILIPQDLSTNEVALTVTCKSGLTLETTLGSGIWASQKTNFYTLNYGATTNWTLDVTPWDDGVSREISLLEPDSVFEVNEDSHTFNVTTAQEDATINVTSAIVVGDEPLENLEWTIKSYKIGSSDPVPVEGSSSFDDGGLYVLKEENSLKLTAHERVNQKKGGHAYWIGDNGDWSPADWTSVTASSPIDLSKFDFKSELTDNPMTTANCYIIRHAGTYRIPLVYGNGMVDGNENTQSYFPDETGGTYRLDRFLNHKGNGIESAFIENNAGCQAASCSIVWQDEAFVIKDLEFVGTTASPYTKDNVRYLQFTVDNSTICQNNAVIAVKDNDGKIIWSWLIWTTNDPALRGEPNKISTDKGDYYLFPMNGVGWMDETEYPAREQVVITIEQSGTGKTKDITVDQPEVSVEERSNYYQFGRKDPMCRKDSPVSEGFIMGGVGKVDLQTAILNPGTFYNFGGGTQPNNDWCSATYYNLWTGKLSMRHKDISGIPVFTKTVYDPSPSGYQMPIFSVFKSGATLSFPAQGLRSRKNGERDYINNSYYWSAFPSDNSDGMYGNESDIQPSCRAHAMSVRPMLEQNPGE